MTEADWQVCDDAGAMLEALWQKQGILPSAGGPLFGGDMRKPAPTQDGLADLERALHRYYVASCRGIWKLLPQEESRRGVELAEQYLSGTATGEQLTKYNWHVEGAAFCIDYNTDPGAINRWVEEVRQIPEAELRSMLHPPEATLDVEPRELLKRAAYFVDYAMIYPSLSPKGPPPAHHRLFLSARVLRQFIKSLAHPLGGGECG